MVEVITWCTLDSGGSPFDKVSSFTNVLNVGTEYVASTGSVVRAHILHSSVNMINIVLNEDVLLTVGRILDNKIFS